MPPTTTRDIERQLAELQTLSIDALRQRWAEAFEKPTPGVFRSDYLIRTIAHHIQAKAQGGLPTSVARRVKTLAENTKIDGGRVTQGARALRPGSRLLREWKGHTHEVEVLESGYRYNGAIYVSLSEVARRITGTRWSGPLFFGLKSTPSKAVKPKPSPTYVVDLSSKSAPRATVDRNGL